MAEIIATLLTVSLHAALLRAHQDRPVDEQAAESAAAPVDLRDRKRMQEYGAAIEQRRGRIMAEVKALRERDEKADSPDQAWAREWAGEYYCGDGLGMNVTICIAPKAGVTYTWYGCLGLYDANQGEIVSHEEGELRTRLELDPKRSSWGFMSERLYLVRWGERHYLVSEGEMRDVCEEYGPGSDDFSRLRHAPLRRADRDKPIGGRPEFPPSIARALAAKDVEAAIAGIEPVPKPQGLHGRVRATVTISAGDAAGVYPWMQFRPAEAPGTAPWIITIDSVTDETATGELVMSPGADPATELPKLGQRVTTRSR